MKNARVPSYVAVLMLTLFLTCFLVAAPAFCESSDTSTPDLTPLKTLMTAQQNLHSLSADFTQTRFLKTLHTPLSSKGRLWYQPPNEFRWELGDPAKTILLGTTNGLTTIHPAKKEAEIASLSEAGSLPVIGTFSTGGLSGDESLAELKKRIRIISLETVGPHCQLTFLPRDSANAQELSWIKLIFERETGLWISLEIMTRDGSSILAQFSNVQVNQKLAAGLFSFDLRGFKISDEKN